MDSFSTKTIMMLLSVLDKKDDFSIHMKKETENKILPLIHQQWLCKVVAIAKKRDGSQSGTLYLNVWTQSS